jgi:hypothetical protein
MDDYIVLGTSCTNITEEVISQPVFVHEPIYAMPDTSSIDIYAIWNNGGLPVRAGISHIRHVLTIWLATYCMLYYINNDTTTPYIKWKSQSGTTYSMKLSIFEKWFLCGCKYVK